MSADTVSSLFPDRPIRPLPKRRLRERLSPEAANSIQYPPAPQALTPLFPYPYSLRDEQDSGFGPSGNRTSELDARQSRRNGEGTEEEVHSTAVRGHSGREAPASSGRLSRQQTKADSGRNGNIHQPLSSASSVDGYDSFENTNNKKKRKIPTAGDSALNSVHGLSDNGAGVGSLSTADHPVEGHRDVSGSTSAASYGSNNFGSGGQNVAGPGRGRYGRSRSARSPLRPLPDSTNNRNSKPRPVAWASGPSENTGIISDAIAKAEKLPLPQGQENISLLQQQLSNKRHPASTQFTFTCDSQVPGSVAWPGSDRRIPTPAHQGASARQGSDNWARNQQGSQTGQPPPMPPDADAPSKEATSQSGTGGQSQAAAQKAARRNLARECDASAKARRRETLLYNKRHPPKPEEVWICHFCEYESIFGRPPSALIRQYEIKDRKQRQLEQQRKAQWERLKKGKHKGKKNSKLPAKSNDAVHDPHQTTGAHSAAMNSSYSQGTQSEEYYDDEEYEDEGYEPDEDIPPDCRVDVPEQAGRVMSQSHHRPLIVEGT